MTGLTDEKRNDFNAMKKYQKQKNQLLILLNNIQDTKIVNKKQSIQKEVLNEWGLEIKKNCVQIQVLKLDPGKMLMGRQSKLNLGDTKTNLYRYTQAEMYLTPTQKLIQGIIYNVHSGQQAMDFYLDNCRQACQEFQFNVFYQSKFFQMLQDREEERVLQDIQVYDDQNQTKINFLLFLLYSCYLQQKSFCQILCWQSRQSRKFTSRNYY